MRRTSLLMLPLLLFSCKKVFVTPDAGTPVDTGVMEPPITQDPACQLQTQQDVFDLATYRDKILPLTLAPANLCASAGCHLAPLPMDRPVGTPQSFAVWANSLPGTCEYAKSFNSFTAHVDLANPTNSSVYVQVTGGNPTHPVIWPTTDQRSIDILDFINAASIRAGNNPGMPSMPPPIPASPFDFAVFQSTIAPILDNAAGRGCSAAACHGQAQGINGFALKRAPALDSQEMIDNFNAITTICDLTTPANSKFYLQATRQHGNGTSAVVDLTQGNAILDWILDAQENAPNTGNPGGACQGVENFDVATFASEILPILHGDVNLNDRNNPTIVTGCSRGACHGDLTRTGGALIMSRTLTPAQNLANFTCFVNFANPSASDIVTCPRQEAGCSHQPHPGGLIFADPQNDLNYQRLLSYLYSAKTAATPLDFGFFARVINPMFSDPTIIEGGVANQTCAAGNCHGVSGPGQSAPNGSNFPIIPSAIDEARIAANFSSAANFVNVVQAEASSLFLYPTNEIGNPLNPFSSALPHPGGPTIGVMSKSALDILTFAEGLRPDANGVANYFLVGGDHIVNRISDVPQLYDGVEDELKPAIFDPTGSTQFNDGRWDFLQGVDGLVDLNLAFARVANPGRVVYAVVYVLNQTTSDIEAKVIVNSPNEVKLWVDEQSTLEQVAPVDATARADFPAYVSSRRTTKIMLKIFQRVEDVDFNFRLNFVDEDNNPLIDDGKIVFKTGSSEGGI